MTISRSPALLAYYRYLIDKALVPLNGAPSPALVALATGDFDWVEIPYYQRGISWDTYKVDLFLSSHSVLLGNVIFSQFSINNKFPYMPPGFDNYVILVDGLQRFAIGTMLLNALHPLVITHNPQRQGDAAFFAGISARVRDFAPVYQHNDAEFRNHPRRAIADQYTYLANSITDYVNEMLDGGQAQVLAGYINRALQDLPECKSGFTASESPEEFLPFFGQVDRDSLFTHGVVTR